MLIDWFTVVAQAVNFLILVWLMKRFLYQPILKALDAREQRIAAELADAAAKEAEAEAEREEFRRKNDEFDQQRAGLLRKATDEAAAEHLRLFDAARRDADALRDKLNDKLSSEYHSLHEEIARRTQAEVFAIARKTLADLAGVGLEQRIVDVFIQRLVALDGGEKLAAATTQDVPAVVRSAFELSPAQRSVLEGALRSKLGAGITVQFELAPGLVGGIELILHGQKIAWSIADYLADMEKTLAGLLKAQRKPEQHGS